MLKETSTDIDLSEDSEDEDEVPLVPDEIEEEIIDQEYGIEQ